MNSQDNRFPSEASNPMIIGPRTAIQENTVQELKKKNSNEAVPEDP